MLNILMTSYNRPLFVAKALASIQAQTSPDWTCIILDDNSNAATLRAIQPFLKDSRFVLTEHNTTEADRKAKTRYAALINSVLPNLSDGLVCYMCDNVEYKPDLVKTVLDWFWRNPNAFSGYVIQERDVWIDGVRRGPADAFGHWPVLPPQLQVYSGAEVAGMIDHSQVFHRLPAKVKWEEDISTLRNGDAVFFTRLIDAHGSIYPMTTEVMTIEHLIKGAG